MPFDFCFRVPSAAFPFRSLLLVFLIIDENECVDLCVGLFDFDDTLSAPSLDFFMHSNSRQYRDEQCICNTQSIIVAETSCCFQLHSRRAPFQWWLSVYWCVGLATTPPPPSENIFQTFESVECALKKCVFAPYPFWQSCWCASLFVVTSQKLRLNVDHFAEQQITSAIGAKRSGFS